MSSFVKFGAGSSQDVRLRCLRPLSAYRAAVWSIIASSVGAARRWRRRSHDAERPIVVAFAVLAVTALVATACGGSAGTATKPSATTPKNSTSSLTKPKYGGNMVVDLEANWNPIDPLDARAIDDGDVQSAVYNTLFNISTTGIVGPELATKYTVSGNGLTYTLTLRKGVLFQDGTPFNAQAVVFNLDRLLNPSNDCPCLSEIDPIHSVTAVGSYTVIIRLSSKYADLPTVLGGFPGEMVSPSAVAKYGASYGLHPVGTGPFKFESQVADHSVTFVRWSGYWQKGLPYLNSITFQVATNPAADYDSVQSGVVQDDENTSDVQVKEAATNPAVKVKKFTGLGTVFVEFNEEHAPFNNRLARLAVAYATNDAILNEDLPICGGNCPPVEEPFTPASFVYTPHVSGYPTYNISKAKQLVKQLGGLSFTFAIAAGDPPTTEFAEALISQWNQAGIKASISQFDQVTLINNNLSGNYQAMLYRWQGGYDPDQNTYQFFYCGSTVNSAHVCDTTLDTLLAEGRSTTNVSERKIIYGKVSQELAHNMPYDFLYYSVWHRIESANLHGIPSLPNDYFNATSAWLS